MSNKDFEARQRADDSQAYRDHIAQQNRDKTRTKRVTHQANNDEELYSETFGMSFTKGLKHDKNTGLVENTGDFRAMRQAILDGYIEPFQQLTSGVADPRLWEAPTAGFVFDPQGPDAQAVTMAPAPQLGSDELTFEMAEVYELAILRDVPFEHFVDGPTINSKVNNSADRLNKLSYAKDNFNGRPRAKISDNTLSAGTVFRGSSPGVEIGPYLSCFMLLGTAFGDTASGKDQIRENSSLDGQIAYGAQRIDQKVPTANPEQNFMTNLDEWREIQDGKKASNNPVTEPTLYTDTPRFINTPRDLATYVHFDALYQAYLNACLILLSQGAKFDPSFQRLSGDFSGAKAGGFALFGPPHILSLVTEVATRALKAVRYQKFQVHRRLRPETLAGRINRDQAIERVSPALGSKLIQMRKDLSETLEELKCLTKPETDKGPKHDALLPMAFAEGSPMHPAYGAGHATVAGACVTVLKAFFDTTQILQRVEDKNGIEDIKFALNDGKGKAVKVTTNPGGSALESKDITDPKDFLTLEAELNKLAANISIGRNMGGVHFFTDYYDSVRMGEKIAIGILQDQAAGYPKDAFTLTLNSFDGDEVIITRS